MADSQKTTAPQLGDLMDTDTRLLYVTCPDEKTAESLSRALLEERLVACTNSLPGMTSTYWWEGKITTSKEVVLILKTTSHQVDRVTARVESLHPYDSPCILSLAVEKGSEPYLRWLKGALY
jgi:periplasmic divalent cation tolerance protein